MEREPGRSWVAVALATVVLVVLGVGLAAYTSIDHSDNPYAGTQFAIGLTGVAVGGFTAHRKPGHPLGWIVLLGGLGATLTFASYSTIGWLIVHHPEQETLGRTILAAGVWGWIAARGCFAVLAPQVFPDGWPESGVRRVLLAGSGVVIAATCLAHGRLFTFDYFEGRPPAGTAKIADRVLPWGHTGIAVLAVWALLSSLVGVVRRDGDERAALLPFAIGMLVLLVPTVDVLLSEAFYNGGLPDWVDGFEGWGTTLLPVVLAWGILRRGVMSVDTSVRRATVSGVLVAAGVAIYLAAVWIGSLFVDHGAGPGPVVATGIIAVGLVPARSALDRTLAERLFGARTRPFSVVSELGTRLEHAPAHDDALQLVADTFASELKLPWVAIELDHDDVTEQVVAAGTATDSVDRFELVYRGEPLGSLVVGWRTKHEPFRSGERTALAAFARQVGVVAYNDRLARDLRRSRTVLVHSREDERRRIRRDLHDGLGPMLASVSLSLSAVAQRLGDDPALSSLLHDLDAEVQEAIVDIRRLVYSLRPPALDEFGLDGAVRAHVAQVRAGIADAPAIDVDVADFDTDLPPAVEVAAYRVAMEAITNVVRHAHARRCSVSIFGGDELVVEVVDDGIGTGPHPTPGIGMRSMHERAVELGGSLRITPQPDHGTLVHARFPLRVPVS